MAGNQKRKVAELNNIVFEYLEQLGMREESKREFVSKVRAMIGLDGFRSIWFERMTTQLSQILHEIGGRPPEIDLNEPAAPEDNKVVAAVEEEARGDTERKRKRVGSQHNSGTKPITGTALRIHDHDSETGQASGSGPTGVKKPNKVRPFDKHKN